MLLLHILGATVWTGGHLVLALTILPRVLRDRSPRVLLQFESLYERVGLPALLVQVVTGIWLAYRFLPAPSQWLDIGHVAARPIAAKLLLLALTVILAIDARVRLIPKLSVNNLCSLAWHIVPVTVIAVLFVVVGVSFRSGWLY
jgi:putative copper export protein